MWTITISSLLGVSLTCLLFGCGDSPTPQSKPVLVIGGGFSGLSAGATLKEEGLDFVVLEARNYSGGRVHSIKFGDPSVGEGSYLIESCANWVQGGAPNPVFEAAKRIGLHMAIEPGSDQNFSNYAEIYDENGKLTDISKQTVLLDAVDVCVRDLAVKSFPKDMPLRDALSQCGWNASSKVDEALDFFSFQGEFAIPAEEVSLVYNLPDPTYTRNVPDDYFVVEQRPRGYARVIDELTLPLDDTRVRLGAEVRTLRYNNDGVTAVLVDGSEVEGSAAIVTVPVGVLNARHSSLFDPPLPEPQALALSKYIMANFTKIHMQWSKPFWHDVQRWVIAGDLPSWWNLNHAAMLPGSNMLMAWSDGPEGTRYEEMSDAEVQKVVLERLRKVYPEAPEPIAFHVTRHGQEEYQLGAYSAWPFGMTAADWELAHAPLAGGRISFAGEAWCHTARPFTQGAYLSGQRAVHKWTLPALGRVAGPPSSCDAVSWLAPQLVM